MTATGRPLRIAVLADFEGPHARRWLQALAEHGHEMHAVSFYRPGVELPGVTLHVLRESAAPSATEEAKAPAAGLASQIPASLLRFAHAARYLRAGLRGVLREIGPDLLHAHYVVEHGLYGALAGFHPYVISGWGSDLYREPASPQGWLAAKGALARADAVTANEAAMADRLQDLGVAPDRIEIVRIGAIDDIFLSAEPASVNLVPRADLHPTVISDRALEPLYNVDLILRAFAGLVARMPEARLVVTHDGSERPRLEALAAELGIEALTRFVGRLSPAALRQALAAAQVYVSVPSTDSMAASTMEAMAAGCLPLVGDLPSQELVDDGVNGLRVPVGDVAALTEALHAALTDAELRARAAWLNRTRVEAEGRLSVNVERLERLFYRLTS